MLKSLNLSEIKISNSQLDVRLIVTGEASPVSYLDFHDVKKIYWWLDSWMDEQREQCLNCGHERAGCQVHDG